MPQEIHDRLRLGTASLGALVVASMIGAGVYTTSGFAIGDLGSPWWVIAAWLVGGGIAICGAVGYSQLARQISENGGEYLYLSRRVHPVAGVVAGWVSLLAGFTGSGAFAAVTFAGYLFEDSSPPWGIPPAAIAIALVASLTWMHVVVAKPGIWSQNIIVVLKLAIILAFLGFAFWKMDQWAVDPWTVDPWTVDPWAVDPSISETAEAGPNLFAFLTTVMWISLSYSGFNAAIYFAGDTRGENQVGNQRGSRQVATAMVGGTVVVTVLYVLLNVVFVCAPETTAITYQQNVATIAAEAVGGTALSVWVRGVICLGLATSVSSMLVTGPRVYAKMADDGCMPMWMRQNRESPATGIMFQGALIAVVSAFAGLSSLLSYLGLTLSLSAAATVATIFLPPGSKPDGIGNGDESGSVRIKFARIMSFGFVVSTLVIAAVAGWNKPIEAIAAGGTIAVGIIAYAWQRGSGGRSDSV